MKSKYLSGIAFIILGLLLAFGPLTIFPVCKAGMMVMPCQHTAKTELVLGIFVIVVGILLSIIKEVRFRLWLNIAGVLLGILAVLFPNAITGVCSKSNMACRMLTLPALTVISIILIIFSAANVLFLYKPEKGREVADGTGIDLK